MPDITVADIENAIYKANIRYREELERMCEQKNKASIQDHLIKETHFNEAATTKLYKMINNFTENSKIKYMVGVPVGLLLLDRLLTRLGLY